MQGSENFRIYAPQLSVLGCRRAHAGGATNYDSLAGCCGSTSPIRAHKQTEQTEQNKMGSSVSDPNYLLNFHYFD
jgi:hypothetical protein